jgi:hypothetical protein
LTCKNNWNKLFIIYYPSPHSKIKTCKKREKIPDCNKEARSFGVSALFFVVVVIIVEILDVRGSELCD